MGPDLTRILDVRLYQAFDLDADGRVLAGSDDTGSTQLIEIEPDGTRTPVTALPGACTGRYLPGQRAVIVSHDEGGNELHQLSILRLPLPSGRPAGLADLEPLVRDPRHMHVLADVHADKICYFTNRRNGVAFDPVIRQLVDGSERQLVLAEAMYDDAAMSPDGKWLALTVASPVTASAEHVVLVDLRAPAGQERMTDVTPADAPARNEALAWAPDAAGLYFTSNNDREFLGIARYDLAAGSLTWLVTADDADVTGWLAPDGSVLLVERNDDGASRLALHDAATGAKLYDLSLPSTGCITDARLPAPRWAADSAGLVLSVSGPELPGDVLQATDLRASDARLRQLTHSAHALGQPAATPEQHRIPAAGNELVPCLVYRGAADGPAAVAGSAVVVVHGGPEGQSRQNFNTYVQVLAAAGHTVLVPNVRGSTGYGKAWYSADDKRRRLDSVADLAALHAYLPKLAVDQDRAALWGGSYGGYMVLAGLAFQPELWAAGVDIVGIASFVTFLEHTSAYRRAYREREYGTLAGDREFLLSVSPLTKVENMRAPLFLIHGANDPRVPLSEAEQIYAAMTSRGRDCQLLVYDDEGHGLAKRANRLDAIPEAVEFLARHLAARPASSEGTT
ncbi:MAG TPA: alpha/beta fold hydrolase [Streptosporangiaceae bacterium]|nr:alpha/beta fold hydrolase [Streptosporangiaceae bacterium]